MCAKRVRDDSESNARPLRDSEPVVDWLRRNALSALNPHNGWIVNDVLDMVHTRVREPVLHTLKSGSTTKVVAYSYSLHTDRWAPPVPAATGSLFHFDVPYACCAYGDGWYGMGLQQDFYMPRSGANVFRWPRDRNYQDWYTAARDLAASMPILSFHVLFSGSVRMERTRIDGRRIVEWNSHTIFNLPIEDSYMCDACGLGDAQVMMRTITRVTRQSIAVLFDVHAMQGNELEVPSSGEFNAKGGRAQLVQVEEANVMELWDAARQLHAQYDTRVGKWLGCASEVATCNDAPNFVRIDSYCFASVTCNDESQMCVWFYDRRACAWQAARRLTESPKTTLTVAPAYHLSTYLRLTEPCVLVNTR